MKITGNCAFSINNDILNKNIKNAQSRLKFSHYTNLVALKSILENKTIKLNRIDKVNDLAETEYMSKNDDYKRVFIGCFTHNEEESIPQWYMYTKYTAKDGEQGVYVTYLLDKNIDSDLKKFIDYERNAIVKYEDGKEDKYKIENEWGGCRAYNTTYLKNKKCILRLSLTDVIYSDDFEKNSTIHLKYKDKEIPVIDEFGRFKTEYWKFEYETRIIGDFISMDDTDYDPPKEIYIPLDYNNIKISITLNPWDTPEIKKKVEDICKENLKKEQYEIKYSVLKGKLNSRIPQKDNI